MMALDESALICDLAETYHIYDYKSLPLTRVATFAVGLRENSRIKMKMNDTNYSLDTLLMAFIADKLSLLVWSRTKEAQEGLNRPNSILSALLGKGNDCDKENDIESFSTPEDFERRRREILMGGGN